MSLVITVHHSTHAKCTDIIHTYKRPLAATPSRSTLKARSSVITYPIRSPCHAHAPSWFPANPPTPLDSFRSALTRYQPFPTMTATPIPQLTMPPIGTPSAPFGIGRQPSAPVGISSYRFFYTSEIRGLGSYKGAVHELNLTPSPVPPSRPSATLRPSSLSVGPCRPTLG
ncbi:hypothetical protein PISMIDRAFT_11812 [Pisolithus microcarpus 441]|uniref:Uncharacterized protein n=1 Tax=Pisolithus microcarpus 441 TaxID=765257 RepID=A0A0C9ZHV6_9AGAM|nr:hypothetical protein BKA83DRAFT_11812 [Pisolithus microcarpus]KIK22077.1 hypothetical protein PISMIDRAFT_11812 [Pisolithus microcarpus 441]